MERPGKPEEMAIRTTLPEPKPVEKPAPVEARPATSAPVVPKGFPTLRAPIDIPDVLPDIDLTRAVTDPRLFTGIGKENGLPTGIDTRGRAVSDSGGTVPNYLADKRAVALDGEPPKYPGMLLQAGVEGSVEMLFVVDSAGRAVIETAKVLSSPHEQFTRAVLQALPKMRYVPAEVNGRKIPVIVQQAFTFMIPKN
jgi:periplasmic protein TonB